MGFAGMVWGLFVCFLMLATALHGSDQVIGTDVVTKSCWDGNTCTLQMFTQLHTFACKLDHTMNTYTTC